MTSSTVVFGAVSTALFAYASINCFRILRHIQHYPETALRMFFLRDRVHRAFSYLFAVNTVFVLVHITIIVTGNGAYSVISEAVSMLLFFTVTYFFHAVAQDTEPRNMHR